MEIGFNYAKPRSHRTKLELGFGALYGSFADDTCLDKYWKKCQIPVRGKIAIEWQVPVSRARQDALLRFAAGDYISAVFLIIVKEVAATSASFERRAC